ncbi:UNVERIFIED_CONTAM: Kinesin-like protein KIN-6 [Sesamum angustifolium]|uniref:Kinesin-like protein KIN-6 n=1 Tax=Sesamum angustifolium TaxID=2727405 RepID=A0AAW2L9Y1_9LAMI
MEMKSPLPCPPTVTVRRNPHRKARATPSSAIPFREPLSSPSLSREIFSTELPQNAISADSDSIDSLPKTLSENLKVYLRIRPLTIQKNSRNTSESKHAWPKNRKIQSNSKPITKKRSEACLRVNEDLRSVTVSTPQALQETKRIKSEGDVYEEMVKPLVEAFLKGKSGMLAAMGPSGSGKTHTVFGCPREPGMVPLALRHIFRENESCGTQLSRVFYLSMFEISSEKGKAEKMIDLLHGGDAHQAESLIAQGMLKRATAMTNSNSQSSRSQCIINIRWGSEKGDEVVDGKTSTTTLTIVDLAGAEREKKTGNQGARLLESNFINNTSMVFGLCLRILTVKPGVEDYLDTSFLLRQASPFTKIKFKTLEEPVNLTCNKRPNQALPREEQTKKISSAKAKLLRLMKEFDRGSHLDMPKEIDSETYQSGAVAYSFVTKLVVSKYFQAKPSAFSINSSTGSPAIEFPMVL